MSGKRQHFIPRSLQQGFASHASGDATFTWVYRKATAPFNSNITNVGVEGQFYTEGENTAADDLITAAEAPFSALIQSLRAGMSEPLLDPRLPQLIAHLEIRTRHLRQSFLQASEFLVSKMLDFMSDGEVFAAFLTKQFYKNPSMFREALAEEFAKHKLPQPFVEPCMQLAMLLIPAFIQRQMPQFPVFALALRTVLPKTLKDAAKSGHIKALTKSFAPEARIERYARLPTP